MVHRSSSAKAISVHCASDPYWPNVYGLQKMNLLTRAVTFLGCFNAPDFNDPYMALPPKMRGWLFITNTNRQGTYDAVNNIYTSNVGPKAWLPFQAEIFRVKLDGSGQVVRLMHTRGMPADPTANELNAVPQPAPSLDGSLIVLAPITISST